VAPSEAIVIVAAAGQRLPEVPAPVQILRDQGVGAGPMPAIAAGLGALAGRVGAAFVTGCDAPLLKPASVRWLFERLELARANSSPEEEVDAIVLQDAERLYPLAAVYRTSCAGGLAAAAGGDASLHGALRSAYLKPQFVPAEELRDADPELGSLVNCNTPEEYQAALKRAGLSRAGGG
jgi:molybdopterin-guanine dinucleotide biosynthesis protein A